MENLEFYLKKLKNFLLLARVLPLNCKTIEELQRYLKDELDVDKPMRNPYNRYEIPENTVVGKVLDIEVKKFAEGETGPGFIIQICTPQIYEDVDNKGRVFIEQKPNIDDEATVSWFIALAGWLCYS